MHGIFRLMKVNNPCVVVPMKNNLTLKKMAWAEIYGPNTGFLGYKSHDLSSDLSVQKLIEKVFLLNTF